MDTETNNLIVLCKKCYENNEYFIPLYQKGKKEFEIELICQKNHKIDKNDIIEKVLDNNLKSKLKQCQTHQESFCGWSEKELRNICKEDAAIYLRNNEKFQLYVHIFPNVTFQTELENHTTNDILNLIYNKYNKKYLSIQLKLLKILIDY